MQGSRPKRSTKCRPKPCGTKAPSAQPRNKARTGWRPSLVNTPFTMLIRLCGNPAPAEMFRLPTFG